MAGDWDDLTSAPPAARVQPNRPGYELAFERGQAASAPASSPEWNSLSSGRPANPATPVPAPTKPKSWGDTTYEALGWNPNQGVVDNILGVDQFNAMKDRIGLATGLIDPASYRGRNPDGSLITAEQAAKKPTTIAPYRVDGAARAVDVGIDAFQRSPLAAVGRAIADPLANSMIDGAGIARGGPTLAEQELQRREGYEARSADDAWNRDGTIADKAGRFAWSGLGGIVGGALGDPTALLAPGTTWLQKVLAQAAIGGGVDSATQGVDIATGAREQFDPIEAGISAAGGAALVGGIEAVPAARAWWRARGVDVDHVPDEALVDGALDPAAPGTAALGAPPERLLLTDQRPDAPTIQLPNGNVMRLPAPLAALPDLRGEIGLPSNSNRPVPGGRENTAITPDVIAGEPDRPAAAQLADAAARVRAMMSGDSPSVRAGLLASTRTPPTDASVWARLASRDDMAAANDFPSLPDVPNAIARPLPAVGPTAGIGSRASMVDITRNTESGGRRYGADGKLLTSPKGAQGEMQVMPATAKDPGFGVTPARDNSPDELARVGRDLLGAYTKHFGGDPAKGWAAYNGGVGRVDRAIARYGDAWLSKMPAETRAYVDKNMAALGGQRPAVEASIDATSIVEGPATPRVTQVQPSEEIVTPRLDDASSLPIDTLEPRPREALVQAVDGEPAVPVANVPVAYPPPRDGPADGLAALREQQARDTAPPVPPAMPARAPAPPSITMRRPKPPEDALTLIARKGGLRDDEGHNLRRGGREMGQYAPGGGHVFRKKGMSIDDAGEALHEAGFFTGDRPTTTEVLELLHRAEFEPQYRPADMDLVEQYRANEENALYEERAREQLYEVADEDGQQLSEADVRNMMTLMGEGRTVHQAYREHHELEVQRYFDEVDEADRAAYARGTYGDHTGRESPGEGSGGGPEDARAGASGPAEGVGRAGPDRREGGQQDAFGTRGGDERAALERRTEGRQRSDVGQKPPGSDGGLFDDNSGRQPDFLIPDEDVTAKRLDAIWKDQSDTTAVDGMIRLGLLERAPGAERARLTEAGRKVLYAPARRPDGESGFITGDMLVAPFRALGKAADWSAVRNDGAAMLAKVSQVYGSPKAALKASVDRIGQFGESWAYSADASLRSMADRLDAPTITRVADLFHARAGADDATGRTYHEATDRARNTRTQQLFDALEPHLKDKAAMSRIRDLLATPNVSIRASAAERATAAKVRDLLKDTLEYRRDAGEAIGEVGNGYFPRVIDAMRVARNPTAFVRAAERLYRAVGNGDPTAAATAWAQRIGDTYAGIDGGLENVRPGSTPNSAKAREFGKLADTMLRDFYNTDPFDALASYIAGSVRKAEQARRFGPKGREGSTERAAWVKQHGDRGQWAVMMDQIKDELRASTGDVAGVPDDVLRIRDANLGRLYRPAGNGVSLLHAWNTVSVMDRATISSLGDLAMGFVRGGPRYGVEHLGASLHEFGRRIAGRSDSDATRYAEALGVANDAYGSALLQARVDGGTKLAVGSKTVDAFYRAIGLQQLTDAGRVAATKTGQHFMMDLAADMVSASARTRTRAAGYLRELGVNDPSGFAGQLRQGAPTRNDLLGDKGFAADYATALMRYVDQSILMPTKAQRPTWTTHPVGSLFFALQSYSYGFKKNVIDRVARETAAAARERDPQRLAAASGLVVLAGLTYINDTYLRPALFGSRTNYADETMLDTALRVADRAGVLGPASQFVNMFKGFKYQREPTSALAGPIVGRLGDGVYRTGKAAFFNSPSTNTDERNAAGAVYDLAIEPALDFGALRYMRGGARTAAIEMTGNRNGNGVLPSDREAFMDGVAGPKPPPPD